MSTLEAGISAAIFAVRGLPGVGKTTLAAALARDADVLAHFGGGIFWGDLGPAAQKADDVDTVLRLWADSLGVDVTAHTDPHALARAVSTALARRGCPVLLVLDDAWAWPPIAVLREVAPPGCARLLTKRQQPLARAFVGDASAVTDERPALLNRWGTLCNIGVLYFNEGNKVKARIYLEQALAIAEAVEYPALANAARNGLAQIADHESGNE